ncbi:MAG: tRNA (N(6)-L-threonylcarbamoyladenosine(37)-C(2))-methylthiotransferase MtaB [candidate division KSB1 bacterium]|nr:tRNA (N(6)-L-threonylcarbamoyladenosine(37)-C(2))-methylthiotransferase MtaB [candidate division KSB1 bacterium]
MQKVSITTLGCKLNQAEAAQLTEGFLQQGYQIVDFNEPSDICLINTCCVTAKAEYRCRQLIRKALQKSPEAFLVVTGCYAELASHKLQTMKGVDLILGSDQKFSVFDYLNHPQKRKLPQVVTATSYDNREFQSPISGVFRDHTRAFLKIQDGCDAFCSYCVVPLARGRPRSGHPQKLLQQARELVQKGHKEIVLTGVRVGSYGQDLQIPGALVDLIRQLQHLNGLERVRLSSIEPLELTDDLINLIAESDFVCRHLHVPLQSGDDQILKNMNRRYRAKDYVKVIEKAVSKIPDLGLGTDVMVGFPGETEEQFAHTYQLVEKLPFSYLHVFSYSVREGTRAAQFSELIHPKIQQERNTRLRALGLQKKRAFYQSFIGKNLPVLFEDSSDGKSFSGLSDNYIRVEVQSNHCLINQIHPVKIEKVKDGLALGSIDISVYRN